MNVLIMTSVYPPEHAPAGVNVAELAEELTLAGHHVKVLTGFPSHPSGRLYPGWKAKWVARETTSGGFELIRCLHSFVPRFGLAGKLWYHATFAVSLFCTGLFQGPFDVLVMLSTPVFVGPATALLARVRGARLFYWVLDVHPESVINAGLLKPGLLTTLMKRIDTRVCRRCDAIGTLTDDMRKILVARGLSEDRVVIQRYWVDEDRIRPMPRQNEWRLKHDIAPDRFVALHAGTIGYISGAALLIEAARILRDHEEILFLFAGDGPLKASLEAKTTEYGLANVRFLPFQPEEDLNLMQATGDVGLVTLKPLSGTTSIPSKIHGYAAAGRPVIASVDSGGSVARMVADGGWGWIVPPGDPHALAQAILHAASSPEECRQRGQRARECFVREFGREAVVSEFRRKLEVLCKESRQTQENPGVQNA